MRLRDIRENKNKPEFDYTTIADDMWQEKLKEAKKKYDINFNTENDEAIASRRITVGNKSEISEYATFQCELRSAGGDWESPVYYFRCQLVDGYAEGYSQYSNPFFCYIPGKDGGNPHLTKSKNGGLSAPDNDYYSKDKLPERSERKSWQALQKHLESLRK